VGADRPSDVAGVKPTAGRNRRLKPILINDPSNVVEMKRARNTLAARKSRALKAEHVRALEAEITRLKSDKEKMAQERDYWREKAEGATN